MDPTVYFIKEDEVFGRIRCDDFDFTILLREKFSFFAEGYRFHPRYKAKQWDGKIRLLDTSGRIYLGLWSEVLKFCKEQNHPCRIDPKLQKKELPFDKLETFVDRLNVHSGGEPITPRDYQVQGVHKALEWQKCILLSPTSSGKSLIQYILSRMYENLINDRILIVVPTVALVTQMIDDFCDYSSEIEWDGQKMMHGIRGGVSKETDKHIIVSTYQSLAKVDKSFFTQFGALMVDEVHTAVARTIVKIIENSINATWKVGLTGTLDGCKTNEMTLRGLFGPIFNVITTSELMDRGEVAQLSIDVALVKHPEDKCKYLRSSMRTAKGGEKKRRKATYQEEIEYIVSDPERNKFAMRLAAGLSGNTILMIKNVEHGENLYKWMKEAYPDRDIFLYTGSTDKDERDRIRRIMEEKDNAIIIGSLGVLSTGISIKRLHNLIFAHPSRSRVKTLQSVGRILRLSKFGNSVKLFDIIDDYSIGAYENYVLEHGRIRIQFYTEQKFKFKITEVTL